MIHSISAESFGGRKDECSRLQPRWSSGDFEGNFVCAAFLQFWFNVIHCKSAYKNGIHCHICVPCMLEHVCYEPLSLKDCRFGRYLMLLIGRILCTVWNSHL